MKRVPVHTVFTITYFLLALATMIPIGTASKACLFGYEALCSFTPISTVGLLALAGLHIFLHKRAQVKEATV